ncbi:hypothetical protein BDW22DRAFT_1156101 [Trametopsis cervina]|nr:hypothetical protein BDW22DRAFT_1156101 [Trametopsis cervina]
MSRSLIFAFMIRTCLCSSRDAAHPCSARICRIDFQVTPTENQVLEALSNDIMALFLQTNRVTTVSACAPAPRDSILRICRVSRSYMPGARLGRRCSSRTGRSRCADSLWIFSLMKRSAAPFTSLRSCFDQRNTAPTMKF